MSASTVAEAAPESRLDPEMKAYLASSARAAAGFEDPFRLPIDEARDVIERTQRPFAEGGPEMFASDEVWIPIRGRFMLMRRHKPGPGPRPCLVYFHGGGWVWNSIFTHDRVARELAAASGFTVIVPDYAMAPETPFPGPLEDCVAVIRRLHADAASHDIDPGRILVAGDSAGANLALAATLALRDRNEPIVRGALLNYGAFAPSFDTGSYRAYGTSTLSPQTWKMEFFWRHYLASPEDYANPLAAPLLTSLTGLPPLRLQVAELDVLHDENLALADKARAQGVATEVEVYPGVTHGFLRAVGHVEQAARAIRDGADWLRRTAGL